MVKISIWSMTLAILFSSCNATNQTKTVNKTNEVKMENQTKMTNQQKTIALLESLPSKDISVVEKFVSDKQYMQHNANAADGKEFFKGFVSGGLITKAKVVRSFQDGDYVVAHMDYDFFGSKVAFDVLRFENGQVVEHWDNLADKSIALSPSGHTQLDGPTEIRDLDKTAANKALVRDFIDTILIGQKYDQTARFFDGDNYIQHNTQVPDGVSGFGAAVKAMAEQGIFMIYEKNYKILGEGNFVLTMSEGTFGGKPTAYYDLFRIENGKVAEHWDVMETFSNGSDAKNSNGKF